PLAVADVAHERAERVGPARPEWRDGQLDGELLAAPPASRDLDAAGEDRPPPRGPKTAKGLLARVPRPPRRHRPPPARPPRARDQSELVFGWEFHSRMYPWASLSMTASSAVSTVRRVRASLSRSRASAAVARARSSWACAHSARRREAMLSKERTTRPSSSRL